ncbi:MAG: YigZ family protein [Bacteroidetes bacterium]|nr:YigZ family protein [Bacteroidota bacterium]
MSSITLFTTLQNRNEFKFKEKGSLFIGNAIPVNTFELAEFSLEEIRKKYYDATHNCFAYNLFGNQSRYSDDGEPNGTAGLRILNAIEHFSLINTLVVVTRYYGGVKLGVGPLGKAYYYAAYNVLETSDKQQKELYNRILIDFDYDMTSNVHHFININSVKGIENIFELKPRIICYIKPENMEPLINQLREVSRDTISVEIIGENFLL